MNTEDWEKLKEIFVIIESFKIEDFPNVLATNANLDSDTISGLKPLLEDHIEGNDITYGDILISEIRDLSKTVPEINRIMNKYDLSKPDERERFVTYMKNKLELHLENRLVQLLENYTKLQDKLADKSLPDAEKSKLIAQLKAIQKELEEILKYLPQKFGVAKEKLLNEVLEDITQKQKMQVQLFKMQRQTIKQGDTQFKEENFTFSKRVNIIRDTFGATIINGVDEKKEIFFVPTRQYNRMSAKTKARILAKLCGVKTNDIFQYGVEAIYHSEEDIYEQIDTIDPLMIQAVQELASRGLSDKNIVNQRRNSSGIIIIYKMNERSIPRKLTIPRKNSRNLSRAKKLQMLKKILSADVPDSLANLYGKESVETLRFIIENLRTKAITEDEKQPNIYDTLDRVDPLILKALQIIKKKELADIDVKRYVRNYIASICQTEYDLKAKSGKRIDLFTQSPHMKRKRAEVEKFVQGYFQKIEEQYERKVAIELIKKYGDYKSASNEAKETMKSQILAAKKAGQGEATRRLENFVTQKIDGLDEGQNFIAYNPRTDAIFSFDENEKKSIQYEKTRLADAIMNSIIIPREKEKTAKILHYNLPQGYKEVPFLSERDIEFLYYAKKAEDEEIAQAVEGERYMVPTNSIGIFGKIRANIHALRLNMLGVLDKQDVKGYFAEFCSPEEVLEESSPRDEMVDKLSVEIHKKKKREIKPPKRSKRYENRTVLFSTEKLGEKIEQLINNARKSKKKPRKEPSAIR